MGLRSELDLDLQRFTFHDNDLPCVYRGVGHLTTGARRYRVQGGYQIPAPWRHSLHLDTPVLETGAARRSISLSVISAIQALQSHRAELTGIAVRSNNLDRECGADLERNLDPRPDLIGIELLDFNVCRLIAVRCDLQGQVYIRSDAVQTEGAILIGDRTGVWTTNTDDTRAAAAGAP